LNKILDDKIGKQKKSKDKFGRKNFRNKKFGSKNLRLNLGDKDFQNFLKIKNKNQKFWKQNLISSLVEKFREQT
jgi:hypothetical protein